MKKIVARSLSEYLSECDQLSTQGAVVFRGQTHDHPQVLPSLFRKNAPSVPSNVAELAARFYVECYGISSWDEIESKRLKRLEDSYNPIGGLFPAQPTMNWEEFAEWAFGDGPPTAGFGPGPNYTREDFIFMLRARFEEDDSLALHQDAFLQHYGLPTRTLDVSYDPVVALWFATHEFQDMPDGSRSYTLLRGGTPVVYVFALANADVVDLRTVNCHPWDPLQERIPYYGLRGVKQEGGLYYGATKENPDLRRHLICEFHFSPEIWDAGALGKRFLTTEDVFPPPDKDFFYRALLTGSSSPSSEYYPLRAFLPVIVTR